MKTKRIMIMIDQASRDAFSQLLTAHYLKRKGVKVLLCNQHTLVAVFERFRPDVAYVSWQVGGALMDYLIRNHQKTRLALIDQEGGRLGEELFKRSFKLMNGAKTEVAKVCDKVFVWGPVHAQWLNEMNIVPRDKIEVVGSPRYDPYLIAGQPVQDRYLGVTLRGDPITSDPRRLMETAFHFATFDSSYGIGVGYPNRANYEDKIWHILASTRSFFKIAMEFSRNSASRIVFRPGPWEPYSQYAFLPGRIPSASVVPHSSQYEYVRNAFALLDESSSMGLEGLLAGIPVISTQALIPRLEEHISGEGGGFFNASYMKCYWKPESIQEAIDLLMLAEKGKLEVSPCPEELRQYFKDYHGWPRSRPSSFQIGDGLLKLLELSLDNFPKSLPSQETALGMNKDHDKAALSFSDGKIIETPLHRKSITAKIGRYVFRYVPGSVNLMSAVMLFRHLISSDREVAFRYHYYHSLYPYHKAISSVFESLWQMYETVQTPGAD